MVNSNSAMTNEEIQILSDGYHYLEKYADPPADQDDSSAEWWEAALNDMKALNEKWADYKLMEGYMILMHFYLVYKSEQKTKEWNDFVS